MTRYKKLLLAAIAVEFLALLVWGYHTAVAPLPDWALRLSGVTMLAATPVLAYASVRMMKL